VDVWAVKASSNNQIRDLPVPEVPEAAIRAFHITGRQRMVA